MQSGGDTGTWIFEVLTLGEKASGNGFTLARKPQIPGGTVRGRIPSGPQRFPGSGDDVLEAGAWQQVGS